MVPDIWIVTDKIFFHSGPFFALLPAYNPKNQNVLKKEKAPGDIIILQKCTKNENHMMYGS